MNNSQNNVEWILISLSVRAQYFYEVHNSRLCIGHRHNNIGTGHCTSLVDAYDTYLLVIMGIT